MKNKKKGFTLIELLIVIAIIGILASVILVSLNSARARAREASYTSYAAQMATTLQAAAVAGYIDPTVNYSYACMGTYASGRCWGNATNYQKATADTLLQKIATLPQGELSPHCSNCGVVLYTSNTSDLANFWYRNIRIYMRVTAAGNDSLVDRICSKIGWTAYPSSGTYACYKDFLKR